MLTHWFSGSAWRVYSLDIETSQEVIKGGMLQHLIDIDFFEGDS
jgi:hypothetical protein